jgi:ParB family chromosome partitioning protein
MSSKSKKLGSLADIYQSETLDGTITKIRVERLFPSPDQPRRNAHVSIDDLAASINEDGLLSPLVVTKEGERYRIIAGERRYHAVKKLGWTDVECRILSRKERDLFRISIIENLQRENLSAHEEAAALARLKSQENYSDQDLASVIGKSRNYITEILGIAILPETVIEECRTLGIENKNLMIQVVQAFKKNKLDDFINAYRDGRIKTVKNAKDYIQGKETPEDEPEIPIKEVQVQKDTKSNSLHKSSETNLINLNIHLAGNKITIECLKPGIADQLHSDLKKYLSKYKQAGRS